MMMGIMALANLNAQTVLIRDLFAAMPDSILPTLSKTNRLDLIDFIDAKMRAEVDNALAGSTIMTALTNDSLSLRMSDALRVDMFLREAGEETDSSRWVICVVRTYTLPSTQGQEQVARYYSVGWRPLSPVPPLMHPLVLSPSTILREDEHLRELTPVLETVY